MASKLLLAAGACFTQEGIFDKCALQPRDCSADFAVFRSPHWLNVNDVPVSNMCSDEQTIRTLNSLGRCNGRADRYICTSDKTACRFAAVFEPNTGDCNLLHDFYEDNEFTNAHFGLCDNREEEQKSFCTWSFQECGGSGSGFQWEGADTFFANSKPPCHCDDLKIGACVDSNNDNQYCAVSGEVCDTDTGFTYLKVLDLDSQLSIECNLCSPLSDDDLKIPNEVPRTQDNESNTTKKNGNNNTGQTVGITIGVVLAVTGIIGAGLLLVRSRRANKSATSEDTESVGVTGDEKSLNSML